MSLEFNNEGEINAKQTNRNIILVLLLSLMSASLAQNQLEFGLKSANPSRARERKREREWERGKVESWQRSKWKSKHVACRSEPAINQNGPKKTKQNQQQQRGNQKKEKHVSDLIASAAAACMRLVACTTASECGTPHETETEPDPSNWLYCIYIVYMLGNLYNNKN